MPRRFWKARTLASWMTCALFAVPLSARSAEPPPSTDSGVERDSPLRTAQAAPLAPAPEPQPVQAPQPAPELELEPEELAVPPRRSLPETVRFAIPPSPPGLLDPNTQDIDLNTALRLANVQNPEFLVARNRVTEAVALRQLAAAKFLPSINAGTSYNNHAGVLQQSNGNMLTINRASVLVGAGVNAVAAGTISVPGVVLNYQTAEVLFGYLASRQFVRQQAASNIAVRNQVFLKTATAYTELVRAEGRRAIAIQNRDEVKRVAQIVTSYASAGEGRQADAHRALAQLAEREADVQAAEGEVLVASAQLAQQINIDPSIRLHPTDAAIVPLPVVPDPIPVNQLIALAMLRRPEMESMRAAVQGAFLQLEGMKALPFTPTVLIGYSAGGYGGGSNLVRPVFGSFGGRSDFDALFYWTLRNMGIGNLALINAANARLQVARFKQLGILNMVREQVAASYALTHARFNQIGTTEEAVRQGLGAFERDFDRILARGREPGREVLPIELLNSFDLLARARLAYLQAIVDYNIAQFQLYVAVGQPPADVLARPVPSEGVGPSTYAPEMVPSGPSMPAVGPGFGPFSPEPTEPVAPAPDVPRAPQVMAPGNSGGDGVPVALGTRPALDDEDDKTTQPAGTADGFFRSLMGTSGVLDDQAQRTSISR